MTGTPLRAALPLTSSSSGSVRSLIETPGTALLRAIRVRSLLVPVAVREATTTPRIMSSVGRHLDLDLADPRGDRDRRAVGEPAGAEVVGVHEAAGGAAGRGSAARCCASRSCSRAGAAGRSGAARSPVRERVRRRSRARSPSTSAGARSSRPLLVCSRRGQPPGRSGPRSTPSGRARSAVSVSPERPRRSSRSTSSVGDAAAGPGGSAGCAARAAPARLPSRAVVRSATSRKISQSCRCVVGLREHGRA